MKALVVEDDESVAQITKRMLEGDGFVVDLATNAQDGQTLAFVTDYDVIILDLGLPDGSGLQVIQALRRGARSTPIMVMTGSGDSETTVRALDTGADDYLSKPIKKDEFRARIRALLRRGGSQRTESLTTANLVLNRLSRQVLLDGKELRLSVKEFSLLEHLMTRVDEVVSRTQLLEKLWETDFDPGTNVVDVCVSRLRKKMREGGANVEIESRRGRGFILRETTT
ncbi:MAG: response regulator transcription factor [Gemmatimonadaceae bacterium]|nr:response regulator transcription factor [Gemmatimonadaceae bacterium]